MSAWNRRKRKGGTILHRHFSSRQTFNTGYRARAGTPCSTRARPFVLKGDESPSSSPYARTTAADVHWHCVPAHGQSRHDGAEPASVVNNYKLQIDPRPVRIVNGGGSGAGAVGVDLIPAGFMGKTSRWGGSLPARVLQFGGKFSFLKAVGLLTLRPTQFDSGSLNYAAAEVGSKIATHSVIVGQCRARAAAREDCEVLDVFAPCRDDYAL
jgi:hypothetical protein